MAVDAVVAAAEDADLVVVTTNNAYAVNAATGRSRRQLGRGRRSCARVFATDARGRLRDAQPYDVASFHGADRARYTYGYTADQVEALVRVLFGEVDPTNRLRCRSRPRTGPASSPSSGGLGY